jgi:hypothetical protein
LPPGAAPKPRSETMEEQNANGNGAIALGAFTARTIVSALVWKKGALVVPVALETGSGRGKRVIHDDHDRQLQEPRDPYFGGPLR